MSTNFSELENIDVQLKNFDKIRIPIYQRSYSWEREYVDTFWNDILESINEGREKYFIGPIITKTINDKTVELIDGQQRLTTSLILLSIVRRFFLFEKKDSETDIHDKFYNSISSRFINEDAILGDEGEPIYEMNEENSSIYNKFVLIDSRKDDLKKEIKKFNKKDSNYYLIDAIIYLWDAVDSYCGRKFDSEKLKKIAVFILESLQIINIRVSDEADAFLIFETINDRGRELDTLDLVKNLLFSKSATSQKTKFESIKTNWIKTMSNLDGLKSHSDFLSQYWTSINGAYVKSNLFKLIRDYIKQEKDNVQKFSESLLESSKIFSAIGNLEHDYWSDYSKSVLVDMSNLKTIGAKAINPIIMSASIHFDKVEFEKLLKYLLVFQVRYILICDYPTNKYSGALSQIPPLINSGNLNKAMKVARKLKELGVYPNDANFQLELESFQAPSTQKAKYLLSEIEGFISGSDKIINSNGEIVNIEHILPQNSNQDWTLEKTDIKNDEYEKFSTLLGNLCLSNNKLNREAKNKKFEIKKSIIFEGQIGIKTNEYILECDQWKKGNIIERQKILAIHSVKTWSIPFD